MSKEASGEGSTLVWQKESCIAYEARSSPLEHSGEVAQLKLNTNRQHDASQSQRVVLLLEPGAPNARTQRGADSARYASTRQERLA